MDQPDSIDPRLLLRMLDSEGGEMLVPYPVLVEKLLPSMLAEAWTQSNLLAHIIETVFPYVEHTHLMKAGQHLYELDPQQPRAVRVWAALLLRSQQFDTAEKVLKQITDHSFNLDLSNMLGGLYLQQGKLSLAKKQVWGSLQVDPNADLAIDIFCAAHSSETKDSALLEIAKLPGAWRSRTLYWESLLRKRDIDKLKSDASEVLAGFPRPIPQELLLQLSGDLGNWGYLLELLELCTPHYEPCNYDIRLGSNMLKANLDLGQVDAAQDLLDRLYELDRPEWKETLDFWELEIAKLKLETEDAPEHLEVEVRRAPSPLWRVPLAGYARLFPVKAKHIRVGCIGGSAELGAGHKTEYQLSEIRGILSRSIPLFLAEQMQIRTSADTELMYLTANGTFLLSGTPLDTEELSHFARQRKDPYDYLLACHLAATVEPWRLEVRIIRTIDATVLETILIEIPSSPPEALDSLAGRLIEGMSPHLELDLYEAPQGYYTPSGNGLLQHLIHLEQLLALQLDFSRHKEKKELHVHGHRHILEGMMTYCREHSEDVVGRMILLEALGLVLVLRPAVGRQFVSPCLQLENQFPLQGKGSEVLDKLKAGVYRPN